MGLTKRKLYKAERRAARKKGVVGKIAPIGCPDASQPEVVSALAHICGELGVRVGRGGEYDPLKDEYTVIAKVLNGSVINGRAAGKVQDVKIKGQAVADCIIYARSLWGGRYDRPMSWASA